MAVISKGEKGSWVLLNVTFFFAGSLNPNVTIYEKLFLKEFGTLTLIWPQCQRTLNTVWLLKCCPRTHPPCSQGCFESIHPQGGWLQLHSVCAHKGHFCSLHHPLQGLLNISLSPVFMDAGKTKEVSVELHPHPLRVHSRCALVWGLSACSRRVWATWQRSHVQSWHQNCTQKHWRQERTSRCFNCLYIPSPNMCTRHGEILWYETSALCHSLSVLDEICRSNVKY